jgi:alpha-L-fucosidase
MRIASLLMQGRPSWLRGVAFAIAFAYWPALVVAGSGPSGPSLVSGASSPAPTDPRLAWWRDARFGMFIHWGPSSISGKEISWSRQSTGVGVYDALYQRFAAEKFDARSWVAAARSAGMRYIILTAKHHDGFMLWNTKTDPYNVMNSPLGRDVVAELSSAAREAGIPFCFYFSPGDWKDPDCRHPVNNRRFVDRMHAQLTELLTGYGRVPLVWIDFDGYPCPSRPEETAALIRKLQPGVILNNRLEPLHPDESHGLVGPTGDYATPEQRVGPYCDTVPWETNMTIGTQWSWKPDDRVKSLQQCLEALVRTVGGDGNFLFNVGPRPDGAIEPSQVERLAQMGDWLRANGQAIYATRGGPYTPTATYASTRTADAIFIHAFPAADDALVLPPLPRPVRSASLLDGTPIPFVQTDGSLTLTIPSARRDPNITVVKLLIDGAPLDLAAIAPPSTSGSLAYQRPATASSSIAPRFTHTAQAAFDDNPATYWSPGRDPEIAATIHGRRFDHFRKLPRDPLWLHSGWIEVQLDRPHLVARAVLIEKVDTKPNLNYEPVTSWTIEYDDQGHWHAAAEGRSIGNRADVAFPKAVTSNRFRLSVEAPGRPALAEFQLFPAP